MFSQNLRKLRESKNLSQEQFADKIGVSRQSVSAWESGKSSPEIEKASQIAKFFSISIDQLVGEVYDNNQTGKLDKKEYENSYSQIAKVRSVGILILFLGLAAAAYLSDLKFRTGLTTAQMPNFSIWSGITLMISLAISVPLLTFAGNLDKLANDKLVKSGAKIEETFSDKEIEIADKNKNLGAIILASLAFLAIAAHQIITISGSPENLANATFMILLGIGVTASTYGNSTFAKIQNFEDNSPFNK
ncbi:MAG: helix-turn-helix transcriptional regulator [bacterium]|nr:helix-turn-helix transcriptional regulator [bacterium]